MRLDAIILRDEETGYEKEVRHGFVAFMEDGQFNVHFLNVHPDDVQDLREAMIHAMGEALEGYRQHFAQRGVRQ